LSLVAAFVAAGREKVRGVPQLLKVLPVCLETGEPFISVSPVILLLPP
jgi:hypothetical protein